MCDGVCTIHKQKAGGGSFHVHAIRRMNSCQVQQGWWSRFIKYFYTVGKTNLHVC